MSPAISRTSELKALFRELRLKYTYREGRTYLLADRCGQQADGTWVFKDCQFTDDGDPITENESLIVWNPMMGDQETIPSLEKELIPHLSHAPVRVPLSLALVGVLCHEGSNSSSC